MAEVAGATGEDSVMTGGETESSFKEAAPAAQTVQQEAVDELNEESDDDDSQDGDDEERKPISEEVENFVEVDPTGRFGRYKGFDEREGIEIAWNLSKVSSSVLEEDSARQRLVDEVKLLSKLKHKNIIKIYKSWVDVTSQNVNFITEIFTSGNLRQYSQKHKHVDLKVVKSWARQILSGLVYMHGIDPIIIHRDLKCENIFINGANGEVKIADLGVATLLDNHQMSAHTVIGTPEYMAPELYEQSYDEKVDIYSFGMCILELVTRSHPYSECGTHAQIFKKVLSGQKPAALERVENLDVRQFIDCCIATNSDDRLSAAELLCHPFLVQESKKSDKKQKNASSKLQWKDAVAGVISAPANEEKSATLRQSYEAEIKATCPPDKGSHPGDAPSEGSVHSDHHEYGYPSSREGSLHGDHPEDRSWFHSEVTSSEQSTPAHPGELGEKEAVLHLHQSTPEVVCEGEIKSEETLQLRLRLTDEQGNNKTITFPYDKNQDTPRSVAQEMVDELQLSDADEGSVAKEIARKVHKLRPDWKEATTEENCSFFEEEGHPGPNSFVPSAAVNVSPPGGLPAAVERTSEDELGHSHSPIIVRSRVGKAVGDPEEHHDTEGKFGLAERPQGFTLQNHDFVPMESHETINYAISVGEVSSGAPSVDVSEADSLEDHPPDFGAGLVAEHHMDSGSAVEPEAEQVAGSTPHSPEPHSKAVAGEPAVSKTVESSPGTEHRPSSDKVPDSARALAEASSGRLKSEASGTPGASDDDDDDDEDDEEELAAAELLAAQQRQEEAEMKRRHEEEKRRYEEIRKERKSQRRGSKQGTSLSKNCSVEDFAMYHAQAPVELTDLAPPAKLLPPSEPSKPVSSEPGPAKPAGQGQEPATPPVKQPPPAGPRAVAMCPPVLLEPAAFPAKLRSPSQGAPTQEGIVGRSNSVPSSDSGASRPAESSGRKSTDPAPVTRPNGVAPSAPNGVARDAQYSASGQRPLVDSCPSPDPYIARRNIEPSSTQAPMSPVQPMKPLSHSDTFPESSGPANGAARPIRSDSSEQKTDLRSKSAEYGNGQAKQERQRHTEARMSILQAQALQQLSGVPGQDGKAVKGGMAAMAGGMSQGQSMQDSKKPGGMASMQIQAMEAKALADLTRPACALPQGGMGSAGSQIPAMRAQSSGTMSDGSMPYNGRLSK